MTFLLLWIILSIPAGLFIGRFISVGSEEEN